MPLVSERDALPAGTRLGEFRVEGVLGSGGFGVVYLAFDESLQRQVAIKEYLPAALAVRGSALELTLRAPQHAETFELGLRSFINEARLLARFDHPALVKVYRFWEAHGTAYMAMPYYQGRTVQEARRDMAQPPSEAWLRQLIDPVLDALDCLHREQVFHRDIAPDNILLLGDEEEGDDAPPRPVLLDLGAARHVIGGQTHSLTAILKPSFAPIEQYAETAQLRQGAWTDLYALAAVVHFCITGRPPTPASARAVHDDLVPLAQLAPGLATGFDRPYSASFLHAIDHALAVRPQDRPESVMAWRHELSGIVEASVATSVDVDPECLVAASASSPEGELNWVAETVLVKPKGREKPAGHVVVEAQAYLTTLPAASALLNAPRWPASGSPTTMDGKAEWVAPARAAPTPALEVEEAPLPDDAASAAASAGHAEGGAEAVPPDHPTADEAPVSSGASDEDDGPSPWLPPTASPRRRVHLGLGLAGAFLLVMSVVWWTQSSRGTAPLTAVQAGASATGERSAQAAHEAASVLVVAGALPASAPLRESDEVVVVDSGLVIDEWAPLPTGLPGQPDSSEGAQARPSSKAEQAGSPRAACGDRNFITMAICMKRQCSKPAFTKHQQCREMRRLEQGSTLYP